MRTDVKVAALSLAILAGACGTRKEQTTGLTEDLKKDLAMASAPASDLATAPNSYQRMRFVSAVEQARSSTPAKRPVATKRRTAPVRRPEAVSKPANDVVDEPAVAASETPAATPAPEAVTTVSEPVVINQQPAAEPAPVPVATGNNGSGGDGEIGERRRGRGIGGLGGIFGGIIGAVVIRGGHGGVDKCDPRTDGRNRPPMIERPDFGLPLPTGQTFPARRGR
jgi:hypothetical protein